MLSAAALPILDPASAWHNHPDARLVQMDQPLPDWPATYRQRFAWEGSATSAPKHDQTWLCTHWPVDGVAHIQTAARSLRGMAESLARDGQHDTSAAPYPRCIDLETLPSMPPADTSMQRLAAIWARAHTQKLALGALADDFSRISEWLVHEAGVSWDASKAMRKQPALAVAVGDSQRLTSKDSLSADANALIAALLRRAVKLLDRLDPATGIVHADLAGQRTCGRLLVQTARLLDDAASLAADAARFVEEFDQRWRQLRHQVARVMASTAGGVSSLESHP